MASQVLPVAALVALASMLMASCTRKPEKQLARLGGQTISEGDLRRHIQASYTSEQAADLASPSAHREMALNDYLDSLALAAKARQLGIDKELRFQKAVELMESKSLAELLMARHRERIVKAAQVSVDEVRRSYEEHKGEFLIQPHFTFRQVLVYVKGNPAFPDTGLDDAHAQARAKRALADLRAGTSWEAVAAAYSDDSASAKRGGLIRDGRFGHFPPAVEEAIRTQELGKPGALIRSMFGYHVIQVEDRLLAPQPEPFEQVQEVLSERLSQARAADARQAILAPIVQEVGLQITEAGQKDVSLLDEQAIAPDEILAHVAGQPVREADFRWFVKDAVIAPQRRFLFARPGARQDMLRSFVDMRILEAKARRLGLQDSLDFQQTRALRVEQLLAEFVEQRDQAGPFCKLPSQAQCEQARRAYLERVRAEVGLQVLPQP